MPADTSVPLYAATLAGEWSLIRSRAHYPSDIFAGATISVVVALVASKVWPAHRSEASVNAGPPAGDPRRQRVSASPEATVPPAPVVPPLNMATRPASAATVALRAARPAARGAERLLDQARADLQFERDRHDTSLSELHDQLAQLIARKPTRGPAAKSASAKER